MPTTSDSQAFRTGDPTTLNLL